MTDRDPNQPAPRGGEGSRSGSSGGRQSRTEREMQSGARLPASQAPSSGRQQAAPNQSTRGGAPRARSVVPPPATSRNVRDSFAEPPGGTRRAPSPAPPDPSPARSRPARASAPKPASDDPSDPAAWTDLADEWAEPTGDDWEELPAVAVAPSRPVPSRRRARDSSRSRARARPAIDLSAVRLPSFAGRADLLGDQVSGILIAANVVSLVAMIIRVGSGLGQLPASLVVHLDAAGFPDAWGVSSVLWRLPLIAGMTLLMNLVVAWFIAPIDRFAARFVIAAALGVQLIVWVAVLDFV